MKHGDDEEFKMNPDATLLVFEPDGGVTMITGKDPETIEPNIGMARAFACGFLYNEPECEFIVQELMTRAERSAQGAIGPLAGGPVGLPN